MLCACVVGSSFVPRKQWKPSRKTEDPRGGILSNCIGTVNTSDVGFIGLELRDIYSYWSESIQLVIDSDLFPSEVLLVYTSYEGIPIFPSRFDPLNTTVNLTTLLSSTLSVHYIFCRTFSLIHAR